MVLDFVQPDKRILSDLLLIRLLHLLVLPTRLSPVHVQVWLLLLRLNEVFEAHLRCYLEIADPSLWVSIIEAVNKVASLKLRRLFLLYLFLPP